MHPQGDPSPHHRFDERHPQHETPSPRRWHGALAASPYLAGLAALAWLVLRSGSKPSRWTYPCQQAAFSAASLAFGAPLVAVVVGLRRWLDPRAPLARTIVLAVLGVALTLGIRQHLSGAAPQPAPIPTAAPESGPLLSPSAEYRAKLFHKTDCAPDPAGDHFPGLDELLTIMGAQGTKFFRSPTTSLTAGPDGIVAADDTVVIKINYQWPERGGTNTDLLRGLIRRILDHPDRFTGEVVVAENSQFNSIDGFDRAANNAQDHQQSPHDVVAHFQAQGYRVSHFDWTVTRQTKVLEYSTGDLRNGYVVGPYDSGYLGRTSYPKFQTAYGTRISLKYGLWNESTSEYDRAHLKFINVPVLKSHHSTYGATAAVKHYMGVVTDSLSTNSHLGIGYGVLGAVIGEIHPADLNILDAIWINANPYSGPATTYSGATRRDELVASTDPVALDRWSVKNILIPGFVANGYSPPWPSPSAAPDDPSSAFRLYLDRSMNYILGAGYQVTNDYLKMDVFDLAPPGEPSDPVGAGAPFTIRRATGGFDLAWSAPISGGPVGAYFLYRVDLGTLGSGALPACETALGSGTSAWVPGLPDQSGFLVVGRNGAGDGSFGADSDGHERPSPAPGGACP